MPPPPMRPGQTCLNCFQGVRNKLQGVQMSAIIIIQAAQARILTISCVCCVILSKLLLMGAFDTNGSRGERSVAGPQSLAARRDVSRS